MDAGILPPRNNWRPYGTGIDLRDLAARGHYEARFWVLIPFRKQPQSQSRSTRTQLTDSSNHGAEAVGLLPSVGHFGNGSCHYW